MLDLRPLSARSVVLSLLLGAHPPELAVRDLVALGDSFGIAEPTLRVALTRMVAAGDLDRSDATYRLSARMLERQRRQDVALEPDRIAWTGDWELVVVTSAGRSATDRAELRTAMAGLKLAELREGVWTRPANLARALPDWSTGLMTTFRSVPDDDPAALAQRLFDLGTWNAVAEQLLDAATRAVSGADRLAAAAAIVRHLRTDPALPEQLIPTRWHGPELRITYADYQSQLRASGIRVS